MQCVEKSYFRRGEYVGYGGGQVWRIVKRGEWCAFPKSVPVDIIRGRTLRDVDAQLAGLK